MMTLTTSQNAELLLQICTGSIHDVSIEDIWTHYKPPIHVADSLNALESQYTKLYPNRPKGSDGALGNASHAKRASDHNPAWEIAKTSKDYAVIRAIDLTTSKSIKIDKDKIDLTEKQQRDLIAAIIRREKKNPVDRVHYIIHRFPGDTHTHIWSRTTNWDPIVYSLEDSMPHDHHFHVSLMHSHKAYADTSNWFDFGEPVPPFTFRPIQVASIGPLVPDVNWQCSVKNKKTGEWFVSVSPNAHDSIFIRVSPDGTTQLDSMTVLGTEAHQTQFGVLDDNTLLLTANGKTNDIIALKYSSGTRTKADGKPLHVGTDRGSQIALSPTHDWAIIREFNAGNKETYYRFRLTELYTDNPKYTGEPIVVIPNTVTTQGFGSYGTDLYILKGGTNDPKPYLEKKTFTTGKHVGTQSLTACIPKVGSWEPEGMDGRVFFFKDGNGIARRLVGYDHNF